MAFGFVTIKINNKNKQLDRIVCIYFLSCVSIEVIGPLSIIQSQIIIMFNMQYSFKSSLDLVWNFKHSLWNRS